MNPMSFVDPVALYGHSMHAGGWPKLGWRQTELDQDEGDAQAVSDEDDSPRGLYS